MRSIIFAVLGAICYGLSTVIIEQKLPKVHSTVTIICYFSIVIMFNTLFRQFLLHTNPNPSLTIPTDKTTWFSFLTLSIIVFFGSYFFIEALIGKGGNSIVVSSLLVLSPIAATIFRNFWVKQMPNPYQIAGYLLAAIAVILISIGNQKLQTPQ